MAQTNTVTIYGKLGRDPELKETQGGKKVCTLSIAHTEKYKDKSGNQVENTFWVKVTAWGTLASFISNYFSKGQGCVVTGKVRGSTWTKDGQKHSTLEIVASDIDFSGSAPSKKEDTDDPPF